MPAVSVGRCDAVRPLCGLREFLAAPVADHHLVQPELLADAVAMVGEHRTVPVIGLFVYSRLVFHDVLVDHLVGQHVLDELHSAGGESGAAQHVRVCPIQQ